MAVQLILKNSSVEDKSPTSGQLANGELALNYNEAGAFISCVDSEGNIQQVGGIKISNNPPNTPAKQALWFNPTSSTLFVYDGSGWLAAASGGGGGGGDIATIIGGAGIDAVTASGVATVTVDLFPGLNGLVIQSGKLLVPVASSSTLGAVKVGSGLNVTNDGTLSSTGGGGAVDSVNGQTGTVLLSAADVGALEAGDNVSELTNNVGYVTDAGVTQITAGVGVTLNPTDGKGVVEITATGGGGGGAVDSVNGKTGTVVLNAADVGAATTAQGVKADSALQNGDNVSVLTNDAGYLTTATAPTAPVTSVNNKTGVVVLDAGDVGAATAAQGTTADSALQPGADVSELNNDAGYLTTAPVESVNGETGAVSLGIDDLEDVNVTAAVSGNVLAYNGAVWVSAASPPADISGSSINQLNDVDAGSATNGQVMVWDTNAGNWVPGDAGGGAVDSVNNKTGVVVLNAADVGAATTAQGATADSALQPGEAATTAQGTKADSALQPGDDISDLANDAGYITASGVPAAPVASVNNKTGAVVLTASDVGALKAGDNVSSLNNDAGYITSGSIPAAPVSSVNNKTGAVVLTASDVGAANTTQGAKADSATQPGDNVSTLNNDAGYVTDAGVESINGKTGEVTLYLNNLEGVNVTGAAAGQVLTYSGSLWNAVDAETGAVDSVNGQTGNVTLTAADVGAATTAQGTKADSAIQPSDDVSELNNDAGYITTADIPAAPVDSVNSKTGTVVLTASDVGAATTAQGTKADSALQQGADISELNNDAGYITAASAPVDSVNGKTGTVVLSAADVGAATTAQGALADSATQPGDDVSTLNNDAGYITNAGVTSIIAGDNVTIDPVDGLGAVTINSTGGGGGAGVSSIIAGDGIAVDQATGNVTITNTGGGGGGETYNGASAWGSVAVDGTLNAGLNIASTTQTGTGTYTVTFQTPMPDAEYSVVATALLNTGITVTTSSRTPQGFNYTAVNISGGGFNEPVAFAVFATNAPVPKGGTGTDSWVTFRGTALKSDPSQNPVINQEVLIEASFNVSSVIYNGLGTYTVNFTTPMPTAKYAVSGSATLKLSGAALPRVVAPSSADTCTTNSIQVYTADDGGNYENCAKVSVVINATNATLPQTVTQSQIEAAINNPGASAWGNFNGILGMTVNGSMNVASIVRTNNGRYDVTFATPMPDANYSVVCSTMPTPNGNDSGAMPRNLTANGFNIYVQNFENNATDSELVTFVVFATNALPPKGATGTDSWGSVQGDGTLGASFNVASVTRTAGGEYDIVFTSPMPTADYSVVGSTSGSNDYGYFYASSKSTTGFSVGIRDANNAFIDYDFNFTVNATNAVLPASFTEAQIQAVVDLATSGVAMPIAYMTTTTGSGTLGGKFNIASVTRVSAGTYDVFFTTPMANITYAVVVSSYLYNSLYTNLNLDSFRVQTFDTSGSPTDAGFSAVVYP